MAPPLVLDDAANRAWKRQDSSLHTVISITELQVRPDPEQIRAAIRHADYVFSGWLQINRNGSICGDYSERDCANQTGLRLRSGGFSAPRRPFPSTRQTVETGRHPGSPK